MSYKKIVFSTLLIIIFNFKAFAFDIKAPSVVLQDYLSGEILFEKDADREIYPASMTKIMTSIIAFEMLKNGELSLDENTIQRMWIMRKYLADMNPVESMEFVADKIKKTLNNEEFLISMNSIKGSDM